MRLNGIYTTKQLNWLVNYTKDYNPEEIESVSVMPCNVKGAMRIRTVFKGYDDTFTGELLLFSNGTIQQISKVKEIQL